MVASITHEAACRAFIDKVEAAKAAGAESWEQVAKALGYKSVAAFFGRRKRVEQYLNVLIPSPTGGYSRNGGRMNVAQPVPVKLLDTGAQVEGLKLRGTSTMVDETGKPIIQWIKTTVDDERREAYYRALGDALRAEVPRYTPAKASGAWLKELMVTYPIGDLHVGMLSWPEETGAEWNLKLAQDIQCAAMASLVNASPAAAEAVVISLGDWLHYDSMASITPASGHHLDSDSRYGKVIRVAESIMRTCIELALEKHRRVRVICAQGNHDETGALWLAQGLAGRYEQEKRITIDTSPSLFNYFTHGKCLVGVHHGHKVKPQNLPAIMAARRAEEWGKSTYRSWYLGHVHHQRVFEFPGCFVESFNTLAAPDAYASGNGYESVRNMKAITLHTERGEVSRTTVRADMFGASA